MSETIGYCFITNPHPEMLNSVIGLYRHAGWWEEPPDDLELISRLIRGSHCFLCAFDGKEIVGMGRAISDGVSDAYIQDVVVKPDHRNRGIGRRIVEKLVGRIEHDGIGWIGLIAENNTQPFYEPLGFRIMENAVPMLRRKK